MRHLTPADRSEIENGLHHRNSFHVIAQILGVARSTVKREILLHAVDSEKGAKGRVSIVASIEVVATATICVQKERATS